MWRMIRSKHGKQCHRQCYCFATSTKRKPGPPWTSLMDCPELSLYKAVASDCLIISPTTLSVWDVQILVQILVTLPRNSERGFIVTLKLFSLYITKDVSNLRLFFWYRISLAMLLLTQIFNCGCPHTEKKKEKKYIYIYISRTKAEEEEWWCCKKI